MQENKHFISFAEIDRNFNNSFIINSLSKNFGMSGWRVGYVLTNKDAINQILKLNQHLITCAPTILQNYMAEHFDEILHSTIPQARLTAQKRNIVKKYLDEIGLNYLEGEGTFYLMIDVSPFLGTTEEFVYELLLFHNIAVVPGLGYGESTKNFVRFAIGAERLETIKYCLNEMKTLLTQTSYNSNNLYVELKKLNIII